MPAVSLYLQVHQPTRLRRLTFFDIGRGIDYFDDVVNGDILRRVAFKSYIPVTTILTDLAREYGEDFRLTLSMTGVVIDQLRRYCPQALDGFRRLADTGAVEFLGETSHHTLAALYDHEEFVEQVALHRSIIEQTFGVTPKIFRNSELIYSDEIGDQVEQLGFEAILAEGADDVLGWRSPNFVYRLPNSPLRILLKNYRLSDDIAFRFSLPGWRGYPVTAEKYAAWLHELTPSADVVGLFMDFETFGEHQWESTGILDFLRDLPKFVLANSDWRFATASDAIAAYPAATELSFTKPTSWADTDRGVTAWNGNRMQKSAISKIYGLKEQILALPEERRLPMLETFRKLQTSDHFYYMSTKPDGDGAVHSYFSPFESPYDAFIAYMNVMRDFTAVIDRAAVPSLQRAAGW